MFHILKKSNHLFNKIHKKEIELEIFPKGKDDSFTSADYIIQKMFENYLGKFYPEIKIVGEEDTTKDTIKESEYYKVEPENEINFNFLNKNFGSEKTENFSMKDLTFFIDPIDSTSNFIKKKYSPVTVMIGLTKNEIPYFGILHYFCWEGNQEISKTIFNFPGEGIFEVNLNKDNVDDIKKMEFKRQENVVNILTSKSRTQETTMKCIKDIILYLY